MMPCRPMRLGRLRAFGGMDKLQAAMDDRLHWNVRCGGGREARRGGRSDAAIV